MPTFSVSGGGNPGDAGNYFFDSLTTSGSADTEVSHGKSKIHNIWTLFNDSDTTIEFRLPNGGSADFVEVLAGETISFRMALKGYAEKSSGTSKAFRVLGIE